MEEYIGKYNLCRSNCRFYCIFGTSSPSENCKKIPNIDGENKYLVFVSDHLDQSREWGRKKSQATKSIQVASTGGEEGTYAQQGGSKYAHHNNGGPLG